MKRCQKCNRTYPDDNQKFCTFDGGLLITAEPGFDPNATIHSTTDLSASPVPPPPDPNRTIASSQTAPTEVLTKHTGPTGAATIVDSAPGAPGALAGSNQSPYKVEFEGAAGAVPHAMTPVAQPAKKKSKLPMVLGILALLLVLGVGGAVAAFFLVIKPRLDERQSENPVVVVPSNDNENVATNENVNTTEEKPAEEEAYIPPPGAVKFTNSKDSLDGKLAEHYLDFSFYYPNSWQTDPGAGVAGASNFAKVERRIPPDFTQENFAVGWYTSKGTFEADQSTFPQLVEILGQSFAKGFPEYQKVSEGPTKINSLDAYEFRFTSLSKGTEKGDIKLWGRVVFLPTGIAGEQTGATLIMLATSLAPELSGVEDVGEKGQMPVILESFRFARR